MPLIIATKNKAKAADYKRILTECGIDTVSLEELQDPDDVEETGKTLKENAQLKAIYFAKKYQMPAIADDTGFEIDALGGEPGVYARRWPGYDATDEELQEMAIIKLGDTPYDRRTARLIMHVTLADELGNIVAAGSGKIEGIIPQRENCSTKQDPGYPYRSILYIPQFEKLLIDITFEERETLQYRAQAIANILPEIQKIILN
jgi:XTP/dITP diphosphohydrolase